MDEKRKALLDSILEKADRMRVEGTWPVTEDELVEHPGIRDSFEFGFLCWYIHLQEQMLKEVKEVEIVGLKKQILDGSWGYFEIEGNYKEGDKLKIIVIKED